MGEGGEAGEAQLRVARRDELEAEVGQEADAGDAEPEAEAAAAHDQATRRTVAPPPPWRWR